MVARDNSRPSPHELDAVAQADLFRRAAFAAQVGPFRRIFGVMRQPTWASPDSKSLAQNSTRDRVLFVTVSVIGTTTAVFNKSDSDGSAGLRVAFSDNVPGAAVNYLDFILLPGEELHATASAGVTMQVNEQSY